LRVTEQPELQCKALVRLVTEYLDGALAPHERAAFERHVGECEDCGVYLDQMRTTIAALGELPPERLTGSARDRLLATFRSWVGPCNGAPGSSTTPS
jgi:anti-sigma factor RsiW